MNRIARPYRRTRSGSKPWTGPWPSSGPGGRPRTVISSDSEKPRSSQDHTFLRFLSPLRSVRNDKKVFSDSLLVVLLALLAPWCLMGVWTEVRGSEGSDPSVALGPPEDLFPDKARVRYARAFTIEYHGTCKRLEVRRPWKDAGVSFSYILVHRGHEPPPDLPGGAIVVPIPVERLAVASTAWTAFFPMLGVEDALVGLAGCEWVHTPEIVSRIRQGRVQEIGDGGRGMNRGIHLERLILVRPDAVMVHATGIPEYDQHPKLLEAGFKVVINGSHMESSHPELLPGHRRMRYRQLLGVKCLERVAVAAVSRGGAMICEPAVGHEPWREVVLTGPGVCSARLDTAGLRSKRFYDRVDLEVLLRR